MMIAQLQLMDTPGTAAPERKIMTFFTAGQVDQLIALLSERINKRDGGAGVWEQIEKQLRVARRSYYRARAMAST